MNLAETFETRFAEIKLLLTSKASLEAKNLELSGLLTAANDKLETAMQTANAAGALQLATKGELDIAKADLITAQAALKEKTDALAALQAQSLDVDARAKTKAQEILAKAGHRALALEAPAAADASKTHAELWAEQRLISKEKGQEAGRAFYLANKARM